VSPHLLLGRILGKSVPIIPAGVAAPVEAGVGLLTHHAEAPQTFMDTLSSYADAWRNSGRRAQDPGWCQHGRQPVDSRKAVAWPVPGAHIPKPVPLGP